MLAALAPAGFAVWFVLGLDLVVPALDQWRFLQVYDRIGSGTAGLASLFRAHNDLHVHATNWLVMLPLAHLTGWSFKTEVALSLVLLAVMTVALTWPTVRDARVESRWEATTVALVISVLLWSPVQYVLWVWSFGLVMYIVNVCVVLAAVTLAANGGNPTTRQFAFACVACVLASFSRVEGLCAWLALPAGAFLAGAGGSWTRARVGTWCALTVLCWSTVLLAIAGTPAPLDSGKTLGGLRTFDPTTDLASFASFLGAPVGDSLAVVFPSVARGFLFLPVGGLLIVCGCVFLYQVLRHRHEKSARAATAWIALAAYACMFSAALALGRGDLGTASSPLVDIYLRIYAPVLTLFAIAVLQLGYRAVMLEPRGAMHRWLIVAAGVIVVGTGASYATLAPEMLDLREKRAQQRYCIELADYLEWYNPCYRPVTTEIELLKRTGLREIRTDILFVEDNEVIDGEITDVRTLANGALVVSGWTGLLHGRPPEAVALSYASRPGRVFAMAHHLSMEDGRVMWTVEVAAPIVDGPPEPVVAWAYDRAARRFLALSGNASIGFRRPNARDLAARGGSGMLSRPR